MCILYIQPPAKDKKARNDARQYVLGQFAGPSLSYPTDASTSGNTGVNRHVSIDRIDWCPKRGILIISGQKSDLCEYTGLNQANEELEIRQVKYSEIQVQVSPVRSVQEHRSGNTGT